MKKVSFIILTVLILFQLIYIPTAYAESDTTGPELISISVNKTDFNVGETLVVTIKASDALSGLAAWASLSFWSSGGNICVGNFQLQNDGETLIGEGVIDENHCRTGIYKLDNIYIMDNSGNVTSYSTYGGNQLTDEMQLQINVTNNVKSDWEAPILQYVTVDKTEASAGDTLNFEAKATDISGVSIVHVELDWAQDLDTYLSPVEGYPDVFRGSIIIPEDVEDGVYSCKSVAVQDGVENLQFYNIDESTLPEAAQFQVIIHGIQPATETVKVTNIQIEPEVIRQGEPVTVKITLDKCGNNIDKLMMGYQPVVWAKKNSGPSPVVYMEEIEEGLYETTFTPPANWPVGEYVIGELQWFHCKSDGSASGNFVEWQGKTISQTYADWYPTFLVNSLFAGTDNISVLVGSAPFNALAGVSASNTAEGDLTSKIEVMGSVDTSKPGVYLLKYKVLSPYKDQFYPEKQFYYYDFRWVGVTEVQPDSTTSPFVLSGGDLVIGATSGEATIQKDGVSIPFSQVVTEPGEYTLTASEDGSVTIAAAGGGGMRTTGLSAQSAGGGVASFDSAQAAISNDSSATVTAVIDWSGPTLNTAWGKKSSKAIVVTVKASDVSGVAETKYMVGTCSVDQCRAGGTAFTGTFTVPVYGKYTVYAKDRLGYESVTTYNINSSSSSNSAYVESVGISAGSLSRTFSKTYYSYTINLGENQGSVTLTPVKEFEGASMTIAGKAVNSYTVNVANGKSVTVKVKVWYGSSSHTYTFKITRAKSTNSNLATLTASRGSLNTAFDPSVLNYTLTLDENTSSTRISAVVAAAGLAKASPSAVTVKLSNGQTKQIKITVKAQSGAKKTYVITVTRGASTNAALKSLRTSSSRYPLTPRFSKDVTKYQVMLPASTGSVTIYAAAAGYKATVYIDGVKKTSKKVYVASGTSTTVHITVVSQAGNTMEYDIIVTRS